VRSRDAKAAARFLRKALHAPHTQEPGVINVDKNAAYPPAIDDLKADDQLPETTQLRQVKYLNNRVEQDHRFIKRLTKPGMGFASFNSAAANVARNGGNEYDSHAGKSKGLRHAMCEHR
jgi:transposase-like protein